MCQSVLYGCETECRLCDVAVSQRVNKQRIKELVNEYTLLWRGLLGTEYAAQTSAGGGSGSGDGLFGL